MQCRECFRNGAAERGFKTAIAKITLEDLDDTRLVLEN